MDLQDIQEALNIFLKDVMESLKEIVPDVLIEFRQRYIGPQIRKYGNIFRVSDCPCSAASNRVGIVDLRLLSGNTAVHSDMLMWHPQEKPEEIAKQIINCLFSTVQISVNLSQMTDEIKQLIQFWMGFMTRHEELLLKSQIQPKEPQNLYPEICAEYENEKIVVHYSAGRMVELTNIKEKMYFVQALQEQEVCFRNPKGEIFSYEILDCFGRNKETGHIRGNDCEILKVPASGMVIVTRDR